MFLIKPFDHFFGKILLTISSLLLFILIGIGFTYIYLEVNLPDVETLKDVHFQEPLRIYSQDGKLIEEFGSKRRIPIGIEQVPKVLIHAILATEDQRFFEHPGIDLPGLIRALVNMVKTGEKRQGASTITMQVARNFFLTRKKTYARKIKEILLAIKIDKELSKEKILELYLNKIYFGQGAYGVAAAAKTYYNKNLEDLSLAQNAMIAGLPQAPSRINPIANPRAAIKRRNHVLNRMLEENIITKQRHKEATEQPVTAKFYNKQIEIRAPHAAEMIRRLLFKQFGNVIYTSGYKIYSTISNQKQQAANSALKKALEDYDKRHGYRGPIDNISHPDLLDWKKYSKTDTHIPAMVTSINEFKIDAIIDNDQIVTIPLENMRWARKSLGNGRLGSKVRHPNEIVQIGDIVHVTLKNNGQWRLNQIPEIEGAFVAINPQNNQIEALVGGYDFNLHSYDHVTQAKRQPGSVFKTFIYAAALEKGYSLASRINDAPIVKQDHSQDNLVWRPQNDNRKFSGLTSLRKGLTLSRNLVSIRLLESIGLDYARPFIAKLGFPIENIPNSLSIALGSASVTPISIATAYCALANGGKQAKPYLIQKIVNSKGEIVFSKEEALINEAPPEQVISPQVTYLITNVLTNALHHGKTGRMAKAKLNRLDVAGKTGSTNSNKDAWYAGYHSSLVAISWVGFDKPKSIYEYGYKAALPMWLDFMADALRSVPEEIVKEPPGIIRVRIEPKSGLLASSDHPDSFFEIFREDNAPTSYIQSDDIATSKMTNYLF